MKCKKHPKYKAIYKPQCDCETCWRLYIAKQDKKSSRYKSPKSRIDANTFPYLY